MFGKYLRRLKEQAQELKTWIHILYLSCKDSRTPWYARAFTAVVVAYALSPIDIIPDFIPVLGYLDDIVLIPLGIGIALKMIPRYIVEEHRDRLRASMEAKQTGASPSRAALVATPPVPNSGLV
jgi:uncharacterized membrane protein YkvA (DUF1232 family)